MSEGLTLVLGITVGLTGASLIGTGLAIRAMLVARGSSRH